MSTTIDIQVGDRTLTATKAHLKLWIQLSDTYKKFLQASKESNYTMMVVYIYEYLDLALGGIFDWHAVSWLDTVSVFYKVAELNTTAIFIPFMREKKDKTEKEKEEIPWDYEGRSWYSWAHLFSKEYGWSLEYIAEMVVEDALCMLQELLTTDQLEKEFSWAMSEVAYAYNKNTKKSEYKALPRPNWMLPEVEIQKIKIPRSMLPMGVVENLSGMFAESVVKYDT